MAHPLRLGRCSALTGDDLGQALDIPAFSETWVGFGVLFQLALRIAGDRVEVVVQMGRATAVVDALEAAPCSTDCLGAGSV